MQQRFPGRLIAGLGTSVLLLCSSGLLRAQQNDKPSTTPDLKIEAFRKAAANAACGQRNEALRLAREIIADKAVDPESEWSIQWLRSKMTELENVPGEETLEDLFENFKAAQKCGCSERGEAIRLGNKILQNFKDDKINLEVIQYVKRRTIRMTNEDRIRRLYEQFNRSYLNNDWPQFFGASRSILVEDVEQKDILDVSLSAAWVGYELFLGGDRKYSDETLSFARKAVESLESGQQNTRWGAFANYVSREEALVKMKEIIGDLSQK